MEKQECINDSRDMVEIRGFKKIATIVSCVMVQLCVGILYLWSIFTADVQAQYNWNASAANLVASLMMFGFVLGNLIGGYLRDKTNPKFVAYIGCFIFCTGIIATSFLTAKTISLIYLTYSAMAGIGCGFTYGSILGCLQQVMPGKRELAAGISVGAFGLSTVVFAPLSQSMLLKMSVSKTFLILGLSFLGITMLACFFINLPKSDKKAAAQNDISLTPLEAMKKATFWCAFFSCFFANATWNMLVPIIKPLGIQRNLSSEVAVLVVSIAGITNAAARLGMAGASEKLERSILLRLMGAITFACALSLIWAQSYFYLILIALIAFAYGGTASLFPIITIDITGTRYAGTNYGIVLLSLGFSSVIFTALSNFLRESTGSYTGTFILAACTGFMTIILMFIYKKLRKQGTPSLCEK